MNGTERRPALPGGRGGHSPPGAGPSAGVRRLDATRAVLRELYLPATADTDPGPGARRRRWLTVLRNWVASGVIALTALLMSAKVLRDIPEDSLVSRYGSSIYWVSYSNGFVRRGLMGQIFLLVTRGATTWAHASALALAVFGLCLVALALLSRRAIMAAAGPADRLLVAALVLASPFTFFLALYTVGLIDHTTVVAIVAVALLAVAGRDPGRGRVPRAVAIATCLAAAAAFQEISFGFVVPLVVLGLHRLGWTGRPLLAASAAAVSPGVLVAAASILRRPSKVFLVGAIHRAHADGNAVGLDVENAISALAQSAAQGFRFFLNTAPLTLAVFLIPLAGYYLLTSELTRRVLGRTPERPARALIVTFALIAMGVSAFGNDYRRWWGLAFVGVLAGLVMLPGAERPRRRAPPSAASTLVVCAILIGSVGLQFMPFWPAEWDPLADTNFSVRHLQVLDPGWR